MCDQLRDRPNLTLTTAGILTLRLVFIILSTDECTGLEVARHHVSPRKHAAPNRTPNLEPRFVDNDVFPHATFADHRAAPTLPLAMEHLRFVGVVFPDMLCPMLYVEVVDVHPRRATIPLASDRL